MTCPEENTLFPIDKYFFEKKLHVYGVREEHHHHGKKAASNLKWATQTRLKNFTVRT